MLYQFCLTAANACPSPPPELGCPPPTIHDPAPALVLPRAGALKPCGTAYRAWALPALRPHLTFPLNRSSSGMNGGPCEAHFRLSALNDQVILPSSPMAYCVVSKRRIPGDSNHSLTPLHIRDVPVRDTSGKHCNQVTKSLTKNPSNFFLYLPLTAPLKRQLHKCWFGFSYVRTMWRKRKQVGD